MNDQTVALEVVGDFIVSTVRLRHDHGFGRSPRWYETMIFPQENGEVSSWLDLYCYRYATLEEAEAGHKQVVASLVSGELKLGYDD